MRGILLPYWTLVLAWFAPAKSTKYDCTWSNNHHVLKSLAKTISLTAFLSWVRKHSNTPVKYEFTSSARLHLIFLFFSVFDLLFLTNNIRTKDQRFFRKISDHCDTKATDWDFTVILFYVVPLSSAEAPAGYPHQNIIIEKIESAHSRALSFFFSPASPQYKEASAEEKDVVQLRNHFESVDEIL